MKASSKIFSGILDFIVLFSALLFSLVGKDLSKEIFKDVNYVYSGLSYFNTLNVFLIVLARLLFIFIQFLSFNVLIRVFAYVILGFLVSITILITSELSSMMIFFCQIFVFSISAFCFLFRTYLPYEMKDEFWKIVFESLVKIVQISLIVYVKTRTPTTTHHYPHH